MTEQKFFAPLAIAPDDFDFEEVDDDEELDEIEICPSRRRTGRSPPDRPAGYGAGARSERRWPCCPSTSAQGEARPTAGCAPPDPAARRSAP